MKLGQLDPSQLHALVIASKPAKKQRKNLTVGTHVIDCTIRLQGNLVVSGSSSYTSTTNASTAKLLTALLSATTPATAKRMVNAVIAGGPEQVTPAEDSLAAKLAELLIEATKTQAVVTKNGAVTGKITATEV